MRCAAVILFCALTALAASAADVEPAVHKPLAMVQNELITYSDVEARAKRALDNIDQIYRGKERIAQRLTVIEQTLDKIIEERLLVSEGRRLLEGNPGLEDWMKEQVERITNDQSKREGFGIRYNKDLRTSMEDFVLMTFVERRFIKRGVSAGPAEVRAFYDNNPELFILPKRVRYRQIMVRFEDFATEQAALERTQWVRKNIAPDGRDFGQWALKYSAGPHANEGGVWQPGTWSTPEKPLREIIMGLKEGAITQPTKGQDAYYLFFAEQVLPASAKTFHEANEGIRGKIIAEKEARNRKAFLEQLTKRFNVRRFE